VNNDLITMAHGSGGMAMRQLIGELMLVAFDNPLLASLEDQARLPLDAPAGSRLAFTTDSYVIEPLIFPGGDIGKLAVCGTLNDLAVGGAVPRWLSCGLIIEEGLPLAILKQVIESMAAAARAAGVQIVTGDTKVVPRGAADKLFINTAGIGLIPPGLDLSAKRARLGDAIVVSGSIGDHGAAILQARGDLQLASALASDCADLTPLVRQMLAAAPHLVCMRDATRGGVAAVLHEFAATSGLGMRLFESNLPVRQEVRGLCEILGLDPLHFANEGKLLAIVPASEAGSLLAAMRAHPLGGDAAIIGEVVTTPSPRVELRTTFGVDRLLDLPHGEPLPRIC